MTFVRKELKQEEKDILLLALRTFRDKCPEKYDLFINLMGLEQFQNYCHGWDVLKGKVSTEMVSSIDSIGRSS